MLKATLTQRSLRLGGAGSGVVYQLHRTSLNAAAMLEAATVLWGKIKHLKPHYLAAPGLGAAPIAAVLAQVALRDGVVLETLAVRDPAKSRQGERMVEGFAPPAGTSVRMVFVDDTITYGATYRATLKAVAEAGIAAQWVGCALLIDAWHPYGSRRIDASGVPVFSALRRHDVGLTRDSMAKTSAPFDVSSPVWVRHGLISKPEFARKATPVIYQNSVILALDDCSIHSYDLTTGDERWVLEAINPRSKGCGNDLAVEPDGFMLVGLYDGTVTKINTTTGAVAWSRLLAMAIHSAPTVAQTVVYVSTEDRNAQGAACGRVVCLDYATGAMLWQTELGELAPTQTATGYGFVAAAANNGQAFLLDSVTGAVVWQVALPALARGRPVFADGNVIFACENGVVLAISVDDGSIVWQTRASSGFEHSTPLLVNGCVYLVDSSMHLIALCPKTGTLQWVSRLRGKAAWRPTPFGNDGLLTWTTEGHVALHCTRQRAKLWETKAKGSQVYAGNTPAAVGSGHIARLTSDGHLAVFKCAPSNIYTHQNTHPKAP